MSVRNLDALFHPRSIALIGASKQPRSVGAVLAHNLLAAGFDGPVMPVNPHEVAIEGVLTYPSIEALPLVPDLAVVATPPASVPQIVAGLGARGTQRCRRSCTSCVIAVNRRRCGRCRLRSPKPSSPMSGARRRSSSTRGTRSGRG
ncbi:MAG: CoA-binding protein, partial [Geminicoccales bacterium]